MTKILVTGATGTIGRQLVTRLLEVGASVRAGVRDPARAADLEAAGAELVRLDFLDASTHAPALDGASRVFFLSPFTENFHRDLLPFVASMAASGVEHVVRISASGADPQAPLELGRKHAAAEAAVAESGLPWTVLRPTFFMDNFLTQARASVLAEGAFYGASADQPVAYVSTRDIAEVAAHVLLTPAAHVGKVYALTGPQALRNTEVAERIGAAIGKPVRYVDLSAEQLEAGMVEQGTPPWLVEAIGGLEGIKAKGWAAEVSPSVAQMLGRAGEGFEAFITRNAARLS